jgi:hypothetical protein
MTLPLTPDTLRAAYDYLCTTPPFNRWNLPDSEDIVFRVARDRQHCGWYNKKHRYVIAVSRHFIGRTLSLLETMGHEMVHLHAERTGAGGRGEHSAAFKRWAAQVCKVHGFDPQLF